ncbi:MAG: hypothetical protein A2103_00550 [Gammaproteobacteria bacterium GWF2_41_13]|nr:MAG: hypothetical protein A2103_00550 [Gammaproteobacteria bacterium GWF2_41_13]
MGFDPVSFDSFKKEALKDPKFKKEYDALKEEFDLITELIKARKSARKTQQEVAEKMHTSQAVIARLESGFNGKYHSPTLGTIKKYANAVGCRISIKLIPKEKFQQQGV